MAKVFQTTDFLSVDEVFQIFVAMCEFTGTRRGVRHQGTLREAALAALDAAQTGAIAFDDLFELAALYAVSIVKLRPFVEGNARLAGLVAHQFLYMNDINLNATEGEFLDAMANGISQHSLAEFFRARSEPLAETAHD